MSSVIKVQVIYIQNSLAFKKWAVTFTIFSSHPFNAIIKSLILSSDALTMML